jgi:hypothetical protein
MSSKKPDIANKIGQIVREIHAIKITGDTTLNMVLKEFYDVMRKHGIKEGTWSENGRTICNGEWIVFRETLRSRWEMAFTMQSLVNEVPEDLLAYGKEPKRKKHA